MDEIDQADRTCLRPEGIVLQQEGQQRRTRGRMPGLRGGGGDDGRLIVMLIHLAGIAEPVSLSGLADAS